MKFNIVITNNETGETVLNEHTNCIVGAINNGDRRAMGFSLCESNAADIAATVSASREAGVKCCADNPAVALALLLSDCNIEEEKGGEDNE